MTEIQPSFLSIAQELAEQTLYTDIEFKAKGAFKETYRALDPDGIPVALKILNPAKCNLARSQREVEAMTRCNSNVIGKLFEFGNFDSKDGNTYLFMFEEFFDGGTLSDKLQSVLSPEIVRVYGTSLVNALGHLKDLNLVHRDIKPENIMFRQNENVPVLVDFGLVRDLSSSSLTQTWLPQGPGTPFFAAPEQLNNEKSLIGWRTDQFSLGIVLGVCLTLKHPFTQGSMTIPDTISEVAQRKKCSEEFCTILKRQGFSNIIRMLEPWPVNRFNSPAELLQSFEE